MISSRGNRFFGAGLWAIVFFSVAALGFVPSVSRAQTQTAELRVRLEDSLGAPIGGALVALLDPSGHVVIERLSSQDGTRLFRAPAGTYRVRVRRIGFEPFFSEPLSIPRANLVLRVQTRPVELSSVVVTARSPCRRLDSQALTLARVWEEASKALRASQLTIEDLAGVGRAFVYRKEVTNDGAVLRNDTTVFVISSRRPFGAVPPADLAADGYVQGDNRRGWRYFGPDETVLLSDEFAATHCFRVVREASRPGQIGVAFQPVPRRRVSDIAGVLWVDEGTSELREVTFRYVNAGVLGRFPAGGFTRFQRMPSGAWIVEDWRLGAPRLEIRPGDRDQHIAAVGEVEDGGGISAARSGLLPTGQMTAVFGVAYDSVAQRPLSGAIIALGDQVAAADDSGRFAFVGVSSATSVVSFSHPSLSALGFVALEREVSLDGDSLELMLATPSLRTLWPRMCSDTAPEMPRGRSFPGILHGTVRDKSGQAIGGVAVTMRWRLPSDFAGVVPYENPGQLVVVTDETGRYVACGFRTRLRGTVFAGEGVMASPTRPFSFAESPIVRRDFDLDLRPVTDTASSLRELIVTVLDPAGKPLPDASVSIEGSSVVAHTNDAGVSIFRTPEQELVLVVRRIGFTEQTSNVVFGDSRRRDLRIALSPVVPPPAR